MDSTLSFQPQFDVVIDELRHYLKRCLGSNLHSIYLFGSLARKTAVVGRSNMDVVLITHRDLNQQQMTLISSIKWRIEHNVDEVTSIDLRHAQVDDVMDLNNIFSWGFMLKQCCVCIDGDDLSECYGEFEPNWEIAKHWNMDLKPWLSAQRQKIALAEQEDDLSTLQIDLAKKLLRASYGLVMHKDKKWLDDPVACGQAFLTHHPLQEKHIERLHILLTGRVIAKRSVVGLLDLFGDWLSTQYERTEFRIG